MGNIHISGDGSNGVILNAASRLSTEGCVLPGRVALPKEQANPDNPSVDRQGKLVS
jgi:hypothetical protein